jgi:hypothetical protein
MARRARNQLRLNSFALGGRKEIAFLAIEVCIKLLDAPLDHSGIGLGRSAIPSAILGPSPRVSAPCRRTRSRPRSKQPWQIVRRPEGDTGSIQATETATWTPAINHSSEKTITAHRKGHLMRLSPVMRAFVLDF